MTKKSALSRLDKHLPGQHNQEDHAGEHTAVATTVAAEPVAVVKPKGPLEKYKEAREAGQNKQTERFVGIIRSPEYQDAIKHGALHPDDALMAAREFSKSYSLTELRQKADILLTGYKAVSDATDKIQSLILVAAPLAATAAGAMLQHKITNKLSYDSKAAAHATRQTLASSDFDADIRSHSAVDETATKGLAMGLAAAVAIGAINNRASSIGKQSKRNAKLLEYYKVGNDLYRYNTSKMKEAGSPLLPLPAVPTVKSNPSPVYVYPQGSTIDDRYELNQDYAYHMGCALFKQLLDNSKAISREQQQDGNEGYKSYDLFGKYGRELYTATGANDDAVVTDAVNKLVAFMRNAPETSLAFSKAVETDKTREERSSNLENIGECFCNRNYPKAKQLLNKTEPVDRYLLSNVLPNSVVGLPFFWAFDEFLARLHFSDQNLHTVLPVPAEGLDHELQNWTATSYR